MPVIIMPGHDEVISSLLIIALKIPVTCRSDVIIRKGQIVICEIKHLGKFIWHCFDVFSTGMQMQAH